MTPLSPNQAEELYAAGKAAVVEAFCRQQAALVAVQQQNEVLGQKVALLEQEIARLSKDSSTSPKPPSSDITRAPRRDKPGRGKEAGKPPNGEKRKQGGQPGQPGQPRHNRALLPAEVVGRVQHYGLGCCPRCDGEEVRLVEEYRAYAYYCTDCETIQYAEFPEAVVKEGLFKERLTAEKSSLFSFSIATQEKRQILINTGFAQDLPLFA